MWIEQLNSYFSELDIASKELTCREGNLSVYLGMSNFDGLAAGAAEAARWYIIYSTSRIEELQIKLNLERKSLCQTYQKSIKRKEVKFPSNPGHMR